MNRAGNGCMAPLLVALVLGKKLLFKSPKRLKSMKVDVVTDTSIPLDRRKDGPLPPLSLLVRLKRRMCNT